MLLPSVVGEVPIPNVRSDVWSYTIRMPLVCRLKIVPTSNLKLIISFLVLHIVLLHFVQVVITCCLNWAHSLNLACLLEVGHQALCTGTWQGCTKILGDLQSKKSLLSSMGDFTHLTVAPRLASYQVLCQPRLLQRHTTHYMWWYLSTSHGKPFMACCN